jgi:hypothetical protein
VPVISTRRPVAGAAEEEDESGSVIGGQVSRKGVTL